MGHGLALIAQSGEPMAVGELIMWIAGIGALCLIGSGLSSWSARREKRRRDLKRIERWAREDQWKHNHKKGGDR